MTSRHTHVMSNAFISSLHQAAKQSALRSCSEGKKIETVREFKKMESVRDAGQGLSRGGGRSMRSTRPSEQVEPSSWFKDEEAGG